MEGHIPLPDETEHSHDIEISDIEIPQKRLRRLCPEFVQELAQSMAELGLRQPITVTDYPDDDTKRYRLVAGLHRVEAGKLLKWPRIRAHILPNRLRDKALLWEIDENLKRAELSPVERAAHQAERKQLYEAEYPETKHGGDRKSSRQVGDLIESDAPAPPRYTADAAQKQGSSERTVQRDAARGEAIAKAGIDIISLAGTPLDKGEQLDALIELEKLAPEISDRVIEQARTGNPKANAKTALKQVKRDNKEAELAKHIVALPAADQKFGVIVEDFEWDFKVWSRETGMDRHAANHYPVSVNAHTVEEIVKHTEGRFTCAADDCVLFMWTTTPYLAIAIDVLRARGFRYVSNYVWGKDRIATGYWNRNKHEHLLIGVKGNIPAPAPGTQSDSLILAPVAEHSAKPECFLEMIEQYFPNLPKLELNRRGAPRPGWTPWGNEVDADAA